MAKKGRGSKSTKLLNKTANTATATGANATAGPSTQSSRHAKISDELKQAVKDLGGDEDDLDLIDGIDESDNEEQDRSATKMPKGEKKPTDEKSLKMELGDFMKGLDFAAVGAVQVDSEDEEEEEEEEEAEEESDEESEDEEEDEDEEEAEDESEEEEPEESEQEEADVPPTTAKATNQKTVESSKANIDQDSSSGINVPASSSWTSLTPQLPPLDAPLRPLQGHALNELRQKALNLLDNLPPLNRASSSSDAAFISQILQSGTHQDKLSALVLLVRESPVHALNELNRLRYMAGWKEDGIGGGSGSNKDQRVAVMKALADWWVNGGGKQQGKLRYFADQPLLAHPQLTDRHLLMYAFEDYLKRWFFNLLQVLEVLSHDTLPFVRTQALHIIFQLLSGNAEQEQNLLRLGVNKLGDTDRPVASKASHHILQLLQAHPAMKAVVAREVSALVLKPIGSTAAAASSSGSHIKFDDDVKGKKPEEKKSDTVNHARYYGLITLNQITLTRKDQEVAGKLVDLYFEVFREILGDGSKKDEEHPIGGEEEEGEIGEDQIEKVAGKIDKWRGRRKGTRPKPGQKKKTAMEQEEELIENSESKLVSAVLTGINRALPFAKLDETMFKSYMDTLFVITHKGTFNTSIQALNLIYQVSKTQSSSTSDENEIKGISDRFYRTLYDSLFDERLVNSSKQAMYLNLLFKSMKLDDRINRVMAFVKRLLQMLGMHQPPFICGALYLLGELFSTTPGLKKMLIEPEDDDIEHFVDADQKNNKPKEVDDALKKKKIMDEKAYDGKKREPLYANADSSCLWDLIPFLNHFHPSVSLQANQLLLSQPLTGSSDISLNSLVSFLDRFVYRNPKKTLQPKGASIMQPAAVSDKSGMIVQNKGAKSSGGEAGLMVNSESFWRKKVDDVPVEMMFFHKYFSEKLKRNESLKKKKSTGEDEDEEDSDEMPELPSDIADEDDDEEEDDSDIDVEEQEEEEEEGSDPEEDEIWKAMKASMPGADDDMGLSDDEDEDESDDMTEYSSEEGEDEDVEVDEDEEEESEDEEEEEEEEEPVKSKTKKGKKHSPSISSDSSFPNFDDEEEDLLSDSEMEMPDIRLDTAVSSDEEQEKVETGKRKRNDDRKAQRKKRKELPMFGSYEDYQALIEAGGEEED
ncbi:hypothetical protein I203_102854 [Kwoniella mangroviensis CBS 8507]|uniref:uncharacterized protein n=1 Tax=Kwoniella mangroviensis CBS 8507 TaxID=1296122 RepID=UPI00304CCED3